MIPQFIPTYEREKMIFQKNVYPIRPFPDQISRKEQTCRENDEKLKHFKTLKKHFYLHVLV